MDKSTTYERDKMHIRFWRPPLKGWSAARHLVVSAAALALVVGTLTASTLFSRPVTAAPRQQQTMLTTQTSSGTPRLDVFYTDYDSGLIFHRWSDDDGNTWTPSWTLVPSSTLPSNVFFYGRPSVVSDSPGRLTIVTRNTSNSLYYKTESNGVWSPATTWNNVPGTLPSFPSKVSITNVTYTFYSDPTVSSWGPGRLDLFVYAYVNSNLDTTKYLLHTWADNSVWSGQWEVVASNPAYGWGSPSAVSWGPGRIDLFARGTNNELEHMWYDGSWHPWESKGGAVFSTPGVTSGGVGSLQILVGNSGGGLSFIQFNNGAWSSWVTIDSYPLGTAPTVADTPDAIHVIADNISQVDHLYRRWTASSGWTSWADFGGTSFNDGNYDPALVAWFPMSSTVPNVLSSDLTTAIGALAQAGLSQVSLTLDNTCRNAAGKVLSQTPAAGTIVPSSSTVNLQVSSGVDGTGHPCEFR
jgi:hypothetical protein